MHASSILQGLRGFWKPRLQLIGQAEQIALLQAELEKLRQQNESMRTGMRRCVTCEYRIAVKGAGLEND